MRVFKVTDDEHLYGGKLGSLIVETSAKVILDLDGEDVVFDKSEVEEVK